MVNRSHISDAATGGRESMDPLDVPLQDDDLLSEVELTTNLIIAATASEDRLPPAEIDRILGIFPSAS